jgi:hypothetical protein
MLLGEYSWLTMAAPYACDLAIFSITYWFCMTDTSLPHWAWINVVIFGMISPLVNTTNNYIGHNDENTDVGFLLDELPEKIVHGYFVSTILLYVAGIYHVFTRSAVAAHVVGHV